MATYTRGLVWLTRCPPSKGHFTLWLCPLHSACSRTSQPPKHSPFNIHVGELLIFVAGVGASVRGGEKSEQICSSRALLPFLSLATRFLALLRLPMAIDWLLPIAYIIVSIMILLGRDWQGKISLKQYFWSVISSSATVTRLLLTSDSITSHALQRPAIAGHMERSELARNAAQGS